MSSAWKTLGQAFMGTFGVLGANALSGALFGPENTLGAIFGANSGGCFGGNYGFNDWAGCNRYQMAALDNYFNRGCYGGGGGGFEQAFNLGRQYQAQLDRQALAYAQWA